jgi:uncharacterized protein (TIGR02246 family)
MLAQWKMLFGGEALMTRFLLAAAACMLACSTARAAEPAPAAGSELPADDLRQINAIFERWQAAWQAHDMHAFGQMFHEDATWIVWTGRIWKGRKAIEDGHAEAHRTFFKNSIQLSSPQETRRVAPDVVVARSLTTLTGDSRQPEATILGHKLLVLTKRNGSWGILYGQNTRLTPEVAAAAR